MSKRVLLISTIGSGAVLAGTVVACSIAMSTFVAPTVAAADAVPEPTPSITPTVAAEPTEKDAFVPAPAPLPLVDPCPDTFLQEDGTCWGEGQPDEWHDAEDDPYTLDSWPFTTGETIVCGQDAKPAIDHREDAIGWWAYCEPALVTEAPAQPAFGLPLCEEEDSEDCYWDASILGNGVGRSFIRWGGVTYYAEAE